MTTAMLHAAADTRSDSPSLHAQPPAVEFSVVAKRVDLKADVDKSKKRKPDRDYAYGYRGKQFLTQLKQRSKPPVDPEKSRIAKEHAARRAQAAADQKAEKLAKIAEEWAKKHEARAQDREDNLARAVDVARELQEVKARREKAEKPAKREPQTAPSSAKRFSKQSLKVLSKPTAKPTTKFLSVPPAVVGSPRAPSDPPAGWALDTCRRATPKPLPLHLPGPLTWAGVTDDADIEFASIGAVTTQIADDSWKKNRVPSAGLAGDGIGVLSDAWGEWRDHSFWTIGSDLRVALRALQKRQGAGIDPEARSTADFCFFAEGANSYVFTPTKRAFFKPALVPEVLMNHAVVYRFTKIDKRFDAECGADEATVNSPPARGEAVAEAVHALRAASLGIGPLVHAACLFPLVEEGSSTAASHPPAGTDPPTALLLVMAKAKGSLADLMNDQASSKRSLLGLSSVVEPVAAQLVRLCFHTGLSGGIAFDIKVGNIVYGAGSNSEEEDRLHLIDFDPLLFVNTEVLGAKGRALLTLLLCACQVRAASESRQRDTTMGRGPATWARAAAKVFAAPLCELWNEVLEQVCANDEGCSSTSAAPRFGAGARMLSNLRFPKITDAYDASGKFERKAEPTYAAGTWFQKSEEERIPLLARSIVGHYLVTTAHAWPSTRAEPWRAGYLSSLGLFVPALINYACFFDAGPPDGWRELLSITAPRPLSCLPGPATQTTTTAAEA